MKIFSKFKDYYDVGLQYGIDPNCKYIRTSKILEYGGELFRHLDILGSCTDYAPTIRGITDVQNLILFCGTLFKCIELYDTINDKLKKTCIYSYDALLKYAKDNNREDILESIKKKHYSFKNLKNIFEILPVINNEQLIQLSIDIGTPIVRYTYKSRNYYNDRIEIELNPNLKDMEFFKVMDPVTAFQELSMFISGIMGGTAPPMIEISDEVRLEKHGFDKIRSFRNM